MTLVNSQPKTTRVKVLVGWCIGPGQNVSPGDEAIIPEWEARMRISQGTAAPIPVEEPPVAESESKGSDSEGGNASDTTKTETPATTRGARGR